MMITHKSYHHCNAITYFLTLEMYAFPKIPMSIIPLEWYRWPKFQGLAHGLRGSCCHFVYESLYVSRFQSRHAIHEHLVICRFAGGTSVGSSPGSGSNTVQSLRIVQDQSGQMHVHGLLPGEVTTLASSLFQHIISVSVGLPNNSFRQVSNAHCVDTKGMF